MTRDKKKKDIEKIRNIVPGLHPCKLNKNQNGKFLGVKDHAVCDIDCKIASAICARYYKGIATNKDNMVMVVYE